MGTILTLGCAAITTDPERAEAAGKVSLRAAVEKAKEAIHDRDLKRLNQAAQWLQSAAPQNEA
ncbi:MAG: hypothetical protein ACP5I1_20655, partial [Candidatus Hinthialibacter sp.]